MAEPLDYRKPVDERNALHDVYAEPQFSASVSGRPEPAPRGAASAGDAHLTAVWDEPTFSAEVGGDLPDDAVTFARWFEAKQIGSGKSWAYALLIAVCAGPFAVFGTLLDATGRGAFGIIAVVFVAPVVEEMLKAAIALWVVERKPYLFRSSAQIGLCMLASGLGFAAIENVLYLYVYIPDASPELWRWRWTVCVLLHVGCSGIAGLGAIRVWRSVVRTRRPARVSLAGFWLTAAALVHGLYNGWAVLFETFGGTF
ncbi:MAG: PrsW family glutamic-type intramembrane protease [Planctomycetota bacterium]